MAHFSFPVFPIGGTPTPFNTAFGMPPPPPPGGFGAPTYPSQYFKDCSALARRTPDLQIVSSNQVVFNVHKVYLATASSIFDDMLEMTGDKKEKGVLPIVNFSEDARTLDKLLSLCYPGEPPHFVHCTQAKLVQLMRSADKLGIARAVDVIGRALCRPSWLAASGIELYTLGCQIEHSTLRDAARPSAAAWPTLLAQATFHIANMGATNFAALLETAQRNKHILSPAEVYMHHTNLNKTGNVTSITSRAESLLFFDSINPEKLGAKVQANTIL